MTRLDYGKYRGIIASIALFLLLDASVLTLNFYISYEIADDAIAVNLAGRQRMLSQRMTKSLLDGDYLLGKEHSAESALVELETTRDLFDSTLNAFKFGGTAKGAGVGQVTLPPVVDETAMAAINAAERVWQPYRGHIDALMAARGDPMQFLPALQTAIDYAREHNLTLLKTMNDLTVRLETLATAKATRLRLIQTIGITLAVCNFIFIILHFIAQLREGDRRIELARRETTEILDTVNEGLFLLDENLVIGGQHSQKLSDIFGRNDIAGRSLNELLNRLVTEKDLHTTREFVGLLFSAKVKEKLIRDLNPLDRLQINLPQKDGSYTTKYISFQFARVYEQNKIAHVLVTVNDITEQVNLAQELEASRGESEQQLEILTNILHADPKVLQMFIDNAHASYNRINAVLREPLRQQGPGHQHVLQNKVRRIFNDIHNLKGEASALTLENFALMAHQFEAELAQLRDKPNLSGNDFLPLTVKLNRLMAYTESVQKLIARIGGLADIPQGQSAVPSWAHLYDLTSSCAERAGKKVHLVASGLAELSLSSERLEVINQVCIQMIRNAVAHGIEKPADRRDANKAELGRIDVRLAEVAGGSLELTVRDDGAGFDYKAIRRRAMEAGLRTETDLECMDNKQLLSLIFEPGFSTCREVGADAGRGVGMDVVRSKINALGGRLSIGSSPGRYCQFVITLPGEVSDSALAGDAVLSAA